MTKTKMYCIKKDNFKTYKKDNNDNYLYIPQNIIDNAEIIDGFIAIDNEVLFDEKECIDYENNGMKRKALQELIKEYISDRDISLDSFILKNEDRLKAIFDINKENK